MLDDVDEMLRVHLRVGADQQRAAAALVVRRERHELEDPFDIGSREAGLEQPLRSPLRAPALARTGRR